MNINIKLDAKGNERLEKAFAKYEEAYQELYFALLESNLGSFTVRATGELEDREKE